MEKEYDVIVAGAGPGGALTALALQKEGVNIALVDKARFPRDKVCGDALSGKVVSILRNIDRGLADKLSVFPEKIGSWGVRFVAPNTQSLDIPFKSEYSTGEDAPGYISKRIDFDNFLVEEVKKHNHIDFLEEWEIGSVETDNTGVRVGSKQNGSTLHAKLLIAADGAHSTIAKRLAGFKMEPKHYCAGIRAYYENVTGLHEDNFIELHFIKDFLPGYFWIFPLANNMVNIGVGMLSSAASKKRVNLKEKMLKIIEEDPNIAPRFKQAKLVGDIKGYGLPLGSKKRRISGERFMLVGDAASLIDPFTGEGIGNAMLSGVEAARQSVKSLKSGDFSTRELLNYDRKVYEKLWSELRLSRTLQNLIKYPWLFNLVVRKAAKSKTLSSMISNMFENLDLRKELGKPSFYFRLLFNK